jgi:hypothetical protein
MLCWVSRLGSVKHRQWAKAGHIRKFMNRFVVPTLSAAVGTLLYTRFLSDAHQLDWGRAIFVGLFSGLGSAIFSVTWSHKHRGQ